MLLWDLNCLHSLKGNHNKICKHAGYDDVREYRYFNPKNNGLDIEGMLEDLRVCFSNFSPLVCFDDFSKRNRPFSYAGKNLNRTML